MAYHVLIGGESRDCQGVEDISKREFQHTSVTFIGVAYERLRSAGVARAQIITVVQLQEYLGVQMAGETGAIDTGIPKTYYRDNRLRVQEKCQRLLAEGGADYDGKEANPGTIWKVLLGDTAGSPGKKVVPSNATAVHFAVYSHGNSHSTMPKEDDAPDGRCHTSGKFVEWYFNMPHPVTDGSLDAASRYVALGNAKHPKCNFYATHLRALLSERFRRRPGCPVVGVLNYCRSGGTASFLASPFSNTAHWPLLLLVSSQSDKDSLVSGLWDAWFQVVCESLNTDASANKLKALFADRDAFSPTRELKLAGRESPLEPPPSTPAARSASPLPGAAAKRCRVGGNWNPDSPPGGPATPVRLSTCFALAELRYYSENVFELLNLIKTRCYPARILSLDFSFEGTKVGDVDPWHVDLKAAVLDWHTRKQNQLADLQRRYKSGEAFRFLSKGAASRFLPCDGTSRVKGGVVFWSGAKPRLTAQQARLLEEASTPFAVELVSVTTSDEACLETVIKHALDNDIARPAAFHGSASDILDLPVSLLFATH
ncbi:hypothetical protein DIPPA_20871 [Diplonema papillatum]|nr:hypothetical protein DIPPA_20871 [Diplonema papillatum]|eukprot:gene17606-27105_t